MPTFESYSLSPGADGVTNLYPPRGRWAYVGTYPTYCRPTYSSVHLGWNSYYRSYNNGDHYSKGPVDGSASGTLSVHPIFHWIRNQIYDYQIGRVYGDPNDNPPKTIFYAEHATVSGGEGISHNNGYSLLDYNAGHPFKGSEFTFSGVTNPLSGKVGDFEFKGYNSDGDSQYHGASYGSDRLQVTKLDTGGSDEVSGQTRTFSGSISLNSSYGALDDPFQLNASACINFSYSIASVNFGLVANVSGASRTDNSDPLNRDVDAFVSRGYRSDGVAEHADIAFWQGRASFDVYDLKGDYPYNESVWPHQTYKWTAGPSVYLPDFPEPSEADKERLLPDASVTHKDFSWDFGEASSAGGFPRTSTVSVQVENSDGDDKPLGPAKVTIHWHTPRLFRVTMSVYEEGGSAPDPLQLNEVEHIDQQIERYRKARYDVVDVGGKGVVVGAAIVMIVPVAPSIIPAAGVMGAAEAEGVMAYNAARTGLIRQILVSSFAFGVVSYDLLGQSCVRAEIRNERHRLRHLGRSQKGHRTPGWQHAR